MPPLDVMTAIDLGTTPQGAPVPLDLPELLATRLLVQGNSGSGKSHLLRRLLEQSAPFVQQVVVDPEGDFVTLAERFGHAVVEADHSDDDLQRIAARVRQHRVSVVLNLEGLDADEQMRSAAAFMGGLFDAPRDHWYPALVVVDEAQLFAPAAAGEVSDEARRLSLGAMTNLMCRGRKRGLAGIIATQRLAKLAKNVAAEASNFLMGRTFLDIDMARAADLLGLDRRQAETFRDLPRGSFVALGPALSKRSLPVKIGPVETESRNAGPSLLPLPEAPADAKGLILTPGVGEPAPFVRAAPPPRPRPVVNDVLVQLSQYRPPPVADETAAAPELSEEAREAGFEAILSDILADPDGAARGPAVLYQDFTVRCRIRQLGAPLSLSAFRRRLAVARTGIDAALAERDEWGQAMARACTIPEDLQSLYLVIARCALGQEPCPDDAVFASVYGTQSTARVRRAIAFLEDEGAIVCRTDPRGARIIALPDLGIETAPGVGAKTAFRRA